MRNKVFSSCDEAIADIPDGASICMEAWGVAAVPNNLIAALRKKGVKDLTVITACFVPQVMPEQAFNFPAILLPQIKKLIAGVVGIQRLGAGAFVKEYVEKGLEVELTSHGMLANRLYAGAVGLGGIYEPVGLGTILEEGKEKRTIDGQEYIFQKPIRADYAFINAYRADKFGNLVYRGIYRGNQPAMAMASKVTIVEVEDEIMEPGSIDPEQVVTPGIFVDRMVKIPEDGLGTLQKQKETINMIGEIEDARKLMFRR
jgi:3-oxoacid CoA-transferase subunit A